MERAGEEGRGDGGRRVDGRGRGREERIGALRGERGEVEGELKAVMHV